MRRNISQDVVSAAIDRMIKLYADGHRIVVSHSGGKDSTCVEQICRIAARETGRLPVEVITRDEEIQFPGTYEYLDRLYRDPEVRLYHVVAHQPIINCANRINPYWWVFDPQVPRELWVRQPPDYAIEIKDINIERMTTPERFPPPEGKTLYAVMGLRAQESHQRLMGLFSSGGYVTKPNKIGVRGARPIYDWRDGDVWKFIRDTSCDYNSAYNTMLKMNFPSNRFRIAPPTMNAAGIETLGLAFSAWPRWADRVNARLPGLKTAAQFGKRAVTPQRKPGETWEDCFKRLCIDEAPAEFIRERAEVTLRKTLSTHASHSTLPLYDSNRCRQCRGSMRSYRDLCRALYNGDPFAQKVYDLPAIEPSFFREGAGEWKGSPSF